MNNFYENTDLLKKLQEGDEAAFVQLFILYREWLFMTAFSLLRDEIEAEELVQEFFIDFWKRRIIKAQIDSIEHLRNYLFISIKNRCLNKITKDQRTRKIFVNIKHSIQPQQPDSALETKELRGVLNNAISHLPPQQAQVFCMAYIEQLSHKEIGYHLRLAEKTVKNHVHLSLKKLRIFLKKNKAIEP